MKIYESLFFYTFCLTLRKEYDKVINASIYLLKEGNSMAVKVTGRKPSFGNRRSHSLRATRHKQGLNLQVVRLEDGTRVRLTTRELKTLRKDQKTAA